MPFNLQKHVLYWQLSLNFLMLNKMQFYYNNKEEQWVILAALNSCSNMAIYVIRQWIHQTTKRLGPRLTSVVPSPGRSIRSTGWRWRRHVSPRCMRLRHSSQLCKLRHQRCHKLLATNHIPTDKCSRSPPRSNHPSWQSSFRTCLFQRGTLSNTCPCCLPGYSFYSHLQCHCMNNTSKPPLIRKKRNTKTHSKPIDTFIMHNSCLGTS